MAAEVEAVAVADLGLGQPADLVLGLEDDDRDAAAGEEVAGGQSGGPAAEHGDGLADLAVVSAREAATRRPVELNGGHGPYLCPSRRTIPPFPKDR